MACPVLRDLQVVVFGSGADWCWPMFRWGWGTGADQRLVTFLLRGDAMERASATMRWIW